METAYKKPSDGRLCIDALCMKTHSKQRQKENIKNVWGCYDPRTNLLIS